MFCPSIYSISVDQYGGTVEKISTKTRLHDHLGFKIDKRSFTHTCFAFTDHCFPLPCDALWFEGFKDSYWFFPSFHELHHLQRLINWATSPHHGQTALWSFALCHAKTSTSSITTMILSLHLPAALTSFLVVFYCFYLLFLSWVGCCCSFRFK